VTTRYAVVSVRVTAAEAGRLRAAAKARGVSVSDLLRARLLEQAEPTVETVTVNAAAGRTSVVGDGRIGGPGGSTIGWDQVPGSVVDGAMFTVSCG